MSFSIIAVTTGAGGSFTISGDQRTKFPNNITFQVFGSTLNDDSYVVDSTSLIAGTTVSGFQVVGVGDNALNGLQEIDVGGLPIGSQVKEVTDITCGADVAGSLSGTHFFLNSADTQYYVWYDVSGGSVDPAPAGRTGIEVDISTNDTASTVASATSTAIANSQFPADDFNTGVVGPVVTVTNTKGGNVTDAADVDTGFGVVVFTQGTGVVNTTPTGLANDATVFTADVFIDTSPTATPVAVTGSTAQTYADLLTEINTDLTGATAEFLVETGNIAILSEQTGDESTISITDTGTPLFASLGSFVAFNTSLPGGVTLSGFQVADVGGGIVTTNDTGLADDAIAEVTDVTTVADIAGSLNSTFFTLDTPGPDYYVWYDVSGGGVDPTPVSRAGITVAITTGDSANAVAAATQLAIDAVSDFSVSVVTDVVTITNIALGAAPDAADGSVPAQPTGFGFVTTTQGSDGTVYTATITVDAGANPISILGSNALNYFDLLTELNADLTGATAAIVDGDVRVTSDSTGASSTISMVDGTLFAALTDFTEFRTAVAVTSTGLPNDATVFTASVSIDGGGGQPIAVTGSAAQNYSELITEINADIAGSTATVDSDRNVRITSVTFGPSSTVAITDTDLFSSLSLFQSIKTAEAGEDDTVITVFGAVPDATVDGSVFLPGSYLLEFSDDTVNPPFMLEPETIDGPPGTTTSLSLIGRGTLNYGERFNENFLRLLENFASAGISPSDPVTGQLWYDDATNLLKVFDGGFQPISANANIVIQDDGSSLINTPHSTINFVGAGVTATDGGGGVANVTVTLTGVTEFATETISAGTFVIGSVAISTNSSVVFEILGVGRETGGQTIAKRIFGSIERTGVAANTALVGSTSEDRTDSGVAAVDWDITVVANTGTGALDIRVDDDGTETVEWKVTIKVLSVTQP